MPETEQLPIPVDIPWKLAATSQPLKLGDPTDSTISIFYHEPNIESLDSLYPDDRLIYLKFTVTVCPISARRVWGNLAEGFFRGGMLPVRHLLFDIGITSSPLELGSSKPYFHSATPLRRTMVESGIVGRQTVEEAKNSVAIGKSGSQFVETISSYTPTGVDLEETVQATDHRELTNSEASTERRELLSHLSRVENVLTLLNAKHLGSPFLQFSLSPRPIVSLLDEEPNNDYESWYQTLLSHRSSGIEGIQEFVAVAVVPRGERFCLQTRLRRVVVQDSPPVKPQLGREPLVFGPDVYRIIDYMFKKYPRGTPIDELDVDLGPQINEKYEDDARYFIRPTVTGWSGDLVIFNNTIHVDIRCHFRVPYRYVKSPFSPFRSVIYKTSHAVWLEMRRAEYLEALARSPLERGIITSVDSTLSTCIEISPDGSGSGGVSVFDSNATNDPPNVVPFQPVSPAFEVAQGLGGLDASVSPVDAWDDLDNQLKNYIGSLNEVPSKPLKLNSPAVVQLFLDGMAAINSDDSRNIPLEECASLFGLNKNTIKKVKAAGICDLQSLARVLVAETETLGERCRKEREEYSKHQILEILPLRDEVCVDIDEQEVVENEDMQFPSSGLDVENIRSMIGEALEKDRDSSEDSTYLEGGE